MAVGAGRLAVVAAPWSLSLCCWAGGPRCCCLPPPSARPDRHRRGGPRDLPERVLLRRGQYRRGDRNRGSAGHRPGGNRFICGGGFRERLTGGGLPRPAWRSSAAWSWSPPTARAPLRSRRRCALAAAAGTCYGADHCRQGAAESGVPATAAMAVTLSLGAGARSCAARPRRGTHRPDR